MRRCALALAGCLLLSLAATAAGVWDTKPFTEWSDKDVEKVTTDSPWAGKASITHARPGATRGPVPDWDLIVSVRSALPYRQALVRRQVGLGGSVTPDLTAALAIDEGLYVIAISGIPRSFQAQAVAIANAAGLKVGDRAVLRPTDARLLLFDKDGTQVAMPDPPARGGAPAGAPGGAPPGGPPGGGFGGFGGGFGGFAEDKSGITATIFLGFPKGEAITAQDDEIELVTTIAVYSLKKTFKLKDMQFKGVLAL